MILATWNVNGVRARAQRLVEWLAERKPDVVCLQELKVKTDELDREALKTAGYHVAAVGQASWNGVAVLSREPLETVSTELPGAAADAGARFIVARLADGLEVASVYIPNGKTTSNPEFRSKLAWLERLAVYVETRPNKDAPFVLAGDFNVCKTDLDSYLGARAHGTIFHTDEERALATRLTAAGLVDLYREKYPAEPGYSWWDYRAGAFHRKLGMRLDLILASEVVARRTKDVSIDREFRKKSKLSGALPSDHAPVIAILD
jgi:exodeoxyribonuclease III